ncbi:AAA family ATPase [Vibrio furnissii]|uniref:AAA family ATPase n=1 Tax=Vibrio furnissii TaxID=29494 RepID=UPI001EECE82A|nr:ATP-binding protein [Vibrio furnissii]
MNRYLNIDVRPGNIAIVIGENGSGKSTLLNNLSRYYTFQGAYVIAIAIANSIHDKFRNESRRFKLLSHKIGRKISLRTIKRALLNINEDDYIKMQQIGDILLYVGYEPSIGVQVNLLKDVNDYILDDNDFLSDEDKYEISTLIKEVKYLGLNDFTWIYLEDYDYINIKSQTVMRLLRYESKLKKLGLISEIEIFLKKMPSPSKINLLDASSGELAFITSLLFITTSITNDSVILIDEPENSLHPKWQKEYLTKLMDVFYYYQPAIICATHSPIIVSGAELSEKSSLTVYKSDYTGVNELKVDSGNLEQMLWEMFGVATPENRFFSQLVMSKLNELAENELTFNEVKYFLESLKNEVYDQKQKDIVSASMKLAEEIERRK